MTRSVLFCGCCICGDNCDPETGYCIDCTYCMYGPCGGQNCQSEVSDAAFR